MASVLTTSLGRVNIDEPTVSRAVDAFVQSLSPHYSSLVRQFSEALREKPDEKVHPFKTCLSLPGDGFIASDHDELVSAIKKGETRYYANLKLKTDALDLSKPIEHLVHRIHQCISSHGILCNRADVRFEKGFFHNATINQNWHFDSPESQAVVICFGTKEPWSTHIVDRQDTRRIFGNATEKEIGERILLGPQDEAPKLKERIESSAESAKFGFLYPVTKILHRGPTKKDVEPESIKADDYRLFIQFTTRAY